MCTNNGSSFESASKVIQHIRKALYIQENDIANKIFLSKQIYSCLKIIKIDC